MNPKERKAARQARIASERRRLRPRPWEFTPSEVYGCACPYPGGVAGHDSWLKAERQCEEILQNDPGYFDRAPPEP